MSPRKKSKRAAGAPRARNGHGPQRQRLIDACISALHIYGPSRTTVEKVVAIAKMSPGIVRFYFDSKAAMLVASLQFLAAEFEERVLLPVAARKSTPMAALEMMVDLYLDPDIASPRKVSVWYAFWGEASSRQEYYDICGQKDESFAALVRELIEKTIAETAQPQLDADGIALGLIGVLEILWQDFAFRTEPGIDRATAKRRCMAYLGSVFPGRFPTAGTRPLPFGPATNGVTTPAGWTYDNARIHALERSRLFQRAWSFVGHESQIPRSGDYLTVDTGTERVLMLRDSAGAVRALRNACPRSPHALVVNRSGSVGSTIECKLHGLMFSLDGRYRSGGHEYLEALDWASAAGLLFARSPIREASVNTSGEGSVIHDAAPPCLGSDAETPPGMMMLVAPREIDVAADWKLVVEQWLESSGLREESDSESTGSLAWHIPAPDDATWSGRAYRRLVSCVPPAAWRRRFVAPNQLIERRPDGLTVVQAVPVAPGRSRVRRWDYTVLPPEEGARAAIYLAQRLGPFARRSLLGVAESIQRAVIDFGYEGTAAAGVTHAVIWFRREVAARIPALALHRPPTGD